MDTTDRKKRQYQRLYNQLINLLMVSPSAEAQMSTINAIIYHKINYTFWVGFYLRKNDRLTIGPYQGPLACQELEYPHGVCWNSIIHKKPVIVADVSQFPDHIACDPRSKSELVVPVKNTSGNIVGVFDVDSNRIAAFDETDLEGIEKIIRLLTFN